MKLEAANRILSDFNGMPGVIEPQLQADQHPDIPDFAAPYITQLLDVMALVEANVRVLSDSDKMKLHDMEQRLHELITNTVTQNLVPLQYETEVTGNLLLACDMCPSSEEEQLEDAFDGESIPRSSSTPLLKV